ncbi:MAG: hypothetical protein K2X38_07390 [Gemmataceae bacterium]|nr:hypothetical protein [Gemmataceae bacterium]
MRKKGEILDYQRRVDHETRPCGLCEREMNPATLTEHHCLPKSQGGTQDHIALICGQCHGMVHATFENRTLARQYVAIESLRDAPELQAFLKWVRKQQSTRRKRNVIRRDKR